MIDLLPYILLLTAIVFSIVPIRKFSLSFIVCAVIAGLFSDRLEIMSLLSIGALGFLMWWPENRRAPTLVKYFCYSLFLLLSLTMMSHLAPGFNNLAIFKGFQFSPDSIPFTMYLNFDKTLVGLFIYLFFLKPTEMITKGSLKTCALVLVALVAVLMPVGFAINYIRVDLKFPAFAGVWMLNNLFFVCLAEEGLFRGFIQGGLEKILPLSKCRTAIAISVGAIAFGLLHFKGGPSYILLSTFAGVFYGYTFAKTKRIECAMLVHFALNTIHFFLFSYPALSN